MPQVPDTPQEDAIFKIGDSVLVDVTSFSIALVGVSVSASGSITAVQHVPSLRYRARVWLRPGGIREVEVEPSKVQPFSADALKRA